MAHTAAYRHARAFFSQHWSAPSSRQPKRHQKRHQSFEANQCSVKSKQGGKGRNKAFVEGFRFNLLFCACSRARRRSRWSRDWWSDVSSNSTARRPNDFRAASHGYIVENCVMRCRCRTHSML
eukprot:6214287-Pleurochrysis_carterae.AAC.3